uniref:Uncharacterized protein n=1 Tax=Kalanchoe fedtschenkoi TaxID=63787 RepID=A0A7N0U096_KALFE
MLISDGWNSKRLTARPRQRFGEREAHQVDDSTRVSGGSGSRGAHRGSDPTILGGCGRPERCLVGETRFCRFTLIEPKSRDISRAADGLRFGSSSNGSKPQHKSLYWLNS